MGAIEGGQVDRAVTEMLRVLTPHIGRDWQVRAGFLDWTCWETGVHVAHDLLAYAGQLAARPTTGYLPLDLTVRPDAGPADVLQVVTAAGALLGNALTSAEPDLRAWHFGLVEPAGFAALGVAETLLHTYDIAQGLAVDWLPPEPLCAVVLRRLLPDAPTDDPVRVLLESTGRMVPEGRPRITSWHWDMTVR